MTLASDVGVLLVHGAWADGSSWAKVVAALKAEGIRAAAPSLPLTSFEDDVAALERALERMPGPVVLAGHAYAGAVIGATSSPKVRGLVYVAALAPAMDESVAEVFSRTEPHPAAPRLEPDAHGLIYLPERAFADAFAQDASGRELSVLSAVQRPIAIGCITVPVPRPSWLDLPAWYLLAERDRMIAPDNQRFMAERMAARLCPFPVDHAPIVTAAESVVGVIREALASLK